VQTGNDDALPRAKMVIALAFMPGTPHMLATHRPAGIENRVVGQEQCPGADKHLFFPHVTVSREDRCALSARQR
jgi:hypothetical protein